MLTFTPKRHATCEAFWIEPLYIARMALEVQVLIGFSSITGIIKPIFRLEIFTKTYQGPSRSGSGRSVGGKMCVTFMEIWCEIWLFSRWRPLTGKAGWWSQHLTHLCWREHARCQHMLLNWMSCLRMKMMKMMRLKQGYAVVCFVLANGGRQTGGQTDRRIDR